MPPLRPPSVSRTRRRPPELPQLTALRRASPGQVALEVDGRPWRTVPDEAVLQAGLAVGVELDRPLLRRLRAALGATRARTVAGRALSRRDLSREELRARLEHARVAPTAAADTLEALGRVGLVDDARVAVTRGRALAERGYGNAAIEARLDAAGVAEDAVREAVAALEPEDERARELLRQERDALRGARLLVRRGFDPELVGELVSALDAGP